MFLRRCHTNSDLLVLVLAAACVPAAKIILMYLEYRLKWPLFPHNEPITLTFALGVAALIAGGLARSWVSKMLLIGAVAVWSWAALFIVAFFPGSLWAPACL